MKLALPFPFLADGENFLRGKFFSPLDSRSRKTFLEESF
jgi:hypothetical protein